MRRLAIALAMAAAAAAGVAAASVLTGASAVSQTPVPRDELPAQTDELGAQTPDPRGGPRWAVRILDRDAGSRCIAAVRTDSGEVGSVDESGRVRPTPAVRTGSCADPRSGPLQIALARFGDSGATGPRTVLLAIAEPAVVGVEVVAPDGSRTVRLDASRTFIVVTEGLSPVDSWTVTATLGDGTSHTYRL